MLTLRHLNCGILHAPPNPAAACHCLLLERGGQLTLIDTGIGLEDIARPLERIGPSAIASAGFQFHEHTTALRQIEAMGFHANAVTDIVLTHGDPDHAGGLADFPNASVHISAEEHSQIDRGNVRYSASQFSHGPRWLMYSSANELWFGMESRLLDLPLDTDVRLIPLFGHTHGHCGVAIRLGDRWVLHVGDAYYLRVELATDEHPVSALASMRADSDTQRRGSLSELRRLNNHHSADISMFGYHDFDELTPDAPTKCD